MSLLNNDKMGCGGSAPINSSIMDDKKELNDSLNNSMIDDKKELNDSLNNSMINVNEFQDYMYEIVKHRKTGSPYN